MSVAAHSRRVTSVADANAGLPARQASTASQGPTTKASARLTPARATRARTRRAHRFCTRPGCLRSRLIFC